MNEMRDGTTRVEILGNPNAQPSKISLQEIHGDIGISYVITRQEILSGTFKQIVLNQNGRTETSLVELQTWVKLIFDSFAINVDIAKNFLDLINKFSFEKIWEGGDDLKALMNNEHQFISFETVMHNLFYNALYSIDQVDSHEFHKYAYDFVNFASIIFVVINKITGKSPTGYFGEIIDIISAFKIGVVTTGIVSTEGRKPSRTLLNAPHEVFVRITLELILALDMFIKDPDELLKKDKRHVPHAAEVQTPKEG